MLRSLCLLGVGCLLDCRTAARPDNASAPASSSTPASADPAPGQPVLKSPGDCVVDEEHELQLSIESLNIQRFDALGLPPGAHFDGRRGVLTFRPDFTQSGRYPITITGHATGAHRMEAAFTLEVRDTVRPPPPQIVGRQSGPGYTLLTLRQTTDTFLDPPQLAGRTIDATLSVPSAASAQASVPAQIWLHGLSGAPVATGSDRFVRLAPHDPDNTYWYGYAERGRSPSGGRVLPYTERRVLHLLSWVRERFPQVNGERVFVAGSSMGGAGALSLALRHPRHFAGALTAIGQSVPRLHKPARIGTLSALWGSPAQNLSGVWDALDLTRVLRDDAAAREQFVRTHHGTDDRIILFTAMVRPSPLTGVSFYDALEQQRVGHYCTWDEGGHGSADPRLGPGWADNNWDLMLDEKARLQRDRPFPAFSRSSANDSPGGDRANGRVAWSDGAGYAGDDAVAGDTGWAGPIAGALNRYLRWDVGGSETSADALRLPLFVAAGPGAPPPQQGYPPRGDRYEGPLPIRVDVTPRRTQQFQPLPGERVTFAFGELHGELVADRDGRVTVPQLPLGPEPTVLELRRSPP